MTATGPAAAGPARAGAIPAAGLCTRYAVVRQAEADGAAISTKCAAELNDADIFTKPLTGAAFARAQASIMGLQHT